MILDRDIHSIKIKNKKKIWQKLFFFFFKIIYDKTDYLINTLGNKYIYWNKRKTEYLEREKKTQTHNNNNKWNKIKVFSCVHKNK